MPFLLFQGHRSRHRAKDCRAGEYGRATAALGLFGVGLGLLGLLGGHGALRALGSLFAGTRRRRRAGGQPQGGDEQRGRQQPRGKDLYGFLDSYGPFLWIGVRSYAKAGAGRLPSFCDIPACEKTDETDTVSVPCPFRQIFCTRIATFDMLWEAPCEAIRRKPTQLADLFHGTIGTSQKISGI